MTNQHRAGGDADAIAILFSRLLEWDVEGVIEKMIKKTSQDQRLPPNLPPGDFEQLPDKAGVYYFYDPTRKVIYVGKAINLKKRVASHFSGHNITPQRQNFLRDTHAISFDVCATELMALLLECTEIKKLWPAYNRALKRFDSKYGLYEYEARSGYRYLAIGKLGKFQVSIESFNSLYKGINVLQGLAKQFGIDNRFCNYGMDDHGEFTPKPDRSDLPEVELHNEQVENAIDFLVKNRPSFAIIDKGRSAEERSCIWVEKGHFYGMGYIASDIGFKDPCEIKDHVTPYKSNQYSVDLILAYAEKYPSKVLFKQNE